MDGTEERRDEEAGELTAGELAEEFLERHRQGERPEVSEYIERYPDLAHEIRELFPAVLMMEHIGSDDELGPGTEQRLREAPKQVGEYRILREVGRGGMGVVYEAEQVSLGRRVALKVLPSHALLSDSQRERFRREAQAAARLHHTNIVPVFGVGEEDGIQFYAMQFIHGESLEKVVEELRALRAKDGLRAATTESLAGKLLTGELHASAEESTAPGEEGVASGRAERPAPVLSSVLASSSAGLLGADSSETASWSSRQHYFRTVARLGAQVAEALAYAHAEGILHRDVKPSNLLLDTRGTLWVTDFGLAKTEGSDSLTQEGDIVGTLAYMAPERFDGWSDPRSDVYGLGVTLYELSTLRRAFEAADRQQLTKQVTEEEPPLPSKFEPRIPRDLETIVLKAIEKEPERRYRSMAEFADDLGRFLRDEPVMASAPSVAYRLRKLMRKHRGFVTAVAAVMVVLTVALAVSLTMYFRAEKAREDLFLEGEAKTQALKEKDDALKEKDQALEDKNRALEKSEGLRLVAQSTAVLPSNPGLALLLGIEASARDSGLLANNALLAAIGELRETRTFVGHSAWVLSAAFSPDGTRVITASDDKTARIWNAQTGEEISTLTGHRGRVWSAAFSPDGTRVLTASRDRTARIWPVEPLRAAMKRKPRDLTPAEREQFGLLRVGADQKPGDSSDEP